MEEFPSTINWRDVDFQGFLALIPTEVAAFHFAMDRGLIDRERTCECGHKMFIHENGQERYGVQFVCSAGRSRCTKKRSILADSWFSGSKVSIRTGLICVAAYAADLNREQLSFFTGIRSTDCSTDWKSYFRDVCSHAVEARTGFKIGGRNCTVEVDETLLFKRKNHTGRLLEGENRQVWFFGGICRESGDCFVVRVPDRSQRTLHDAIRDNVALGSRIVSDCWRGYAGIEQIGYSHSMVNHSRNFVDPDDRTIYTQTIERLWRTLKRVIPKGCNWSTRWSYVNEFIFKAQVKWFSRTIGERIGMFLQKLAEIRFY
jgi:hypothetical protein